MTTRDVCCMEEDSKHALWIDGAPVTDHVEPCNSVSSAEIVGANLWLGTRSPYECSEYPDEGIVVQSLNDGALVKILDTEQRLTGNLIRVIRLDPFGKTVWVATNEGINEVDQNFRVVRTLFFEEKLDPETGQLKLGLSPAMPKDRHVPTLFRDLHVSDGKAFYEAIRSIPTEVQEWFWNGMDEWHVPVPESTAPATRGLAFLPEELNVLVPFFIEAAKSSDSAASNYAWSGIWRGMDLLNDYFKASDGNKVDASLFRCMADNLGKSDEIAPAMIEGLRKFGWSDAWRGCSYFDMWKDSMHRRFDAAYAEALLVALGQQCSPDAPQCGGNEARDCIDAFKSQLKDPGVHRAFFDDIYPKLDPRQKALADKLGAPQERIR